MDDKTYNRFVLTIKSAVQVLLESYHSGYAKELERLENEYGPYAWRLYQALCEKQISVILPVGVVYTRTKNCNYDYRQPSFWHNIDMIIAIHNFIDNLKSEEFEKIKTCEDAYVQNSPSATTAG